MATTSRQTAIFGAEDWKRLYKTYKEADFQSYNFETIRKTFIDYLRQNHPETFNDYTESSELIALLNLIAFMGQSLAFRNDMNTRENFLDTAERRDSVVNLAKLIGYTPKRNEAAAGYVKVLSVSTTENIVDYNRNNLSNVTVRWNDRTNDDWQEQFTAILNAALVDSQSIGNPGNSQTIVGIKTDEYQVNMATGFLPVLPFTATVNGIAMDFEIVNGTSVNSTGIYEPAPRANAQLNVLYRNDNQGFASANTGYFFYFKQGALATQDFTLAETVANQAVDINLIGINDEDVWLYKLDSSNIATEEWTKVDSIYTSNGAQLTSGQRKFYSLTSRASDQITFNFGDGVFSEIPVGTFRAYVRQSNGLDYVINAEEIQNVDLSINYTSRSGRSETITFTIGLTEPVSNAQTRELISDIKRRAPARFYTQDRMVNGEDYNNFPYTAYGSIIKSKALNRSSIGISRYLDLVDPTGKYSSINAFGSDGLIYKEAGTDAFTFTFTNRSDISSVFRNQLEPIVGERAAIQFYYENFTRIDLTALDIAWHQNTTQTNQTSGYFMNSFGAALSIGSFVNDNRKYLVDYALVKFIAPTGYHFNSTNHLVAGASLTNAGDKSEIWATITSVTGEGTANGQITTLPAGTVGPVKLNNFVPTNAIPTQIVPVFSSEIPASVQQLMLNEVELYRDFGIGFDHLTNTWYMVYASNLDTTSPFSLAHAQDISGTNIDASWLVKFISTPSGYEVTTRTLRYYFGSVLETRFFFDNSKKIYDPKTGKVVNDYVKVLGTNSVPAGFSPLTSDIVLDIIGQPVETDGFVNDYRVEISFTDSDSDGVADDPDFFGKISTSTTQVFFERTIDFDNLERFLPIASGTVSNEYATYSAISLVKTQYADGQVFYATTDQKFYLLTVSDTTRTLTETTNYTAEIGRGDLKFQYKHNSPETRSINPGTTNIIDLYLVTASYYAAFSRYIQDGTGTITEPASPTTDELAVAYPDLQNKKMVSDNIVMNSVRFKPLFGNKAATNLQAYIKVVRLNNAVVSDSEIKSKVISTINKYFDIANWDFGDTFYFSELSAYLHTQLGDIIGSVVIVPKDPTLSFGNLYEIKSAPYEIFTSAATVNDVSIIDALTASKLQAG